MNIVQVSRLVAGILLFIAISPLPYGYYMFLRVAISVIAVINAVTLFEKESKLWFALFIAMAILYNPIVPIHMTKSAWVPINVITGLLFGVAAFMKDEEETS